MPRVSGALLPRGLEKSLWGAGDKPGLGLVEKRDFPGQQKATPIPAGSHMWMPCRKTERRGLSCPLQACVSVSRPPDGKEQLQGIKAGRGCDKTSVWRDAVRVHQDRLEETRASLCYSPACQSLLDGAGRTAGCLVITEFRAFMSSVYPSPQW